MPSLKRVLNEYDGRICIKEADGGSETVKHAPEQGPIENSAWPDDFLPQTKYLNMSTEESIEDAKRLQASFQKLGSKKMTQLLTLVDLDMIQQLTADDLITFDGCTASKAIMHIQNKNRMLIAFLSNEFTTGKLFRMLEHALAYRNYNLIDVIIKALRSRKLSGQKLGKVLRFKSILESQEPGIFPLSWMLQDCEDSNLNVESEVASMRFCKIIGCLKEMKKIMLDFGIREKYKHALYTEMWRIARSNDAKTGDIEKKLQNLYLIVGL